MSDPNPSDGDPRLPALLQWRKQLIASGAVSASTFKEAHVRLVLRSGRRDVEQIEITQTTRRSGERDRATVRRPRDMRHGADTGNPNAAFDASGSDVENRDLMVAFRLRHEGELGVVGRG